MKKLICLALCLCLLLCGCGGSAEPQSGKNPQKETAAPAETQAPEETRPLSLGKTEGNTYINEYVGYGCQLDSSWTLYPADVLQEIPEAVKEALEGSEVGDSLENMTQITDMMAENPELLTTVNVVYTKLSIQERLAYAVLDDEAIMDEILKQKDMLISSYAQAGIDATAMEKTTVTFLGEERLAMHTTATMQGVPYFILQVYDYHLGGYGVVTTFASFVEDNTESLLDLFYALEG